MRADKKHIYPRGPCCKGPRMMQTVELPIWLFILILLFRSGYLCIPFFVPVCALVLSPPDGARRKACERTSRTPD